MITATQLCELVEMPFARFETKRRRLRDRLSLDVDNGDYEPLPVKDAMRGKWARYDFEDALLLACTLRLEASGLSFEAAARLVINAGARAFFEFPRGVDFWISRLSMGSVEDRSEKHVAGSMSDLLLAMPASFAIVACNASEVADGLHTRALTLNLEIVGSDVSVRAASA